MTRILLSLLLFGIAPYSTFAQEPAKQPPIEWTPAPRSVTTQFLPYYIPNSLPMPGTREVWQYYGVDSTGRFRALVVNSPLGAYYLYNGQPYPWRMLNQRLIMPNISGTGF